MSEALEAPPAKPKLTRRQVIRRIVYSGGALAVASGTWGANVIEVSRHRVPLVGLPPNSPPLRVVQLSDLHRGNFVSEGMIHRAVEAANAERPDLVLLTGDFVSRDAGFIDTCAEALKRIQARLGTWAVLGNHDYWTNDPMRVQKCLQKIGVATLTNTNTQLEGGLRLIGIDDDMAGQVDIQRAFQGVPDDAAKIVMAHNPLSFNRGLHHNCVVLSGHTHGGQILFPGRAALVKKSFGYVSGWYRNGSTRLYVNRGIGVVILPFRLFAPPEVTVFDFVPQT